MNILDGIKNFLMFINDHWTTIVIIVGLIIAIVKKAKDFFSKSDDEKIEIAKKCICETMLKFVTEAETDYLEWIGAGSIKRAEVIDKIFETYPILYKATNQEGLIIWIDDVIDNALDKMREIFEKNLEKESEDNTETNVEVSE